ncbi:hypothetical protein HFD91_03685 [Enterobacteriaceae bacterium EKM102V]|uniref:hypothetical protein n=1 Tax=Pantoea TaxID=53335 RepID=UPI00142DBBCF|nr:MULTISPECIES: hypothetical protein [Pantoea]KAF6662679.1 hypothetical protein HFD91_03685 [Enterobacteriaceae bacterium EKM102V]KAF6671145.1 hypothetical protein HFD97_03690 [Pantoea sp. EKM103V]
MNKREIKVFVRFKKTGSKKSEIALMTLFQKQGKGKIWTVLFSPMLFFLPYPCFFESNNLNQ